MDRHKNKKRLQLLDLPNEVLLEIFKHLDGVEVFDVMPLVSKRFNELSKIAQRSYSAETTLMIRKEALEAKGSESILKEHKAGMINFRSLTMRIDSRLSKATFKESVMLVKHSRGLRRLELSVAVGHAPEIATVLRESIFSMRYLVELHLDQLDTICLYPTNENQSLYLTCRRNCSEPWTKQDLVRLLTSNRNLRRFGLPCLSMATLNHLLQSPELENSRRTCRGLRICSVIKDGAEKVDWTKLDQFGQLQTLTAGCLDNIFWSVVPTLSKLRELTLNLDEAGLDQLNQQKSAPQPCAIDTLTIYADEDLDIVNGCFSNIWKHFSKVTTLRLEVAVKNPFHLVKIFHGMAKDLLHLRDLELVVFELKEDTSIEEQDALAKDVQKHSFASLEKIAIMTCSKGLDDNARANHTMLFSPILEKLFFASPLYPEVFQTFNAYGEEDIVCRANYDAIPRGEDDVIIVRPEIMLRRFQTIPNWNRAPDPCLTESNNNPVPTCKTKDIPAGFPLVVGLCLYFAALVWWMAS